MRRLTPFIAGGLLVSACASGPNVTGTSEENLPIVEKPVIEIGDDSAPMTEGPIDEPGDSSLVGGDDSIVVEPQSDAVNPDPDASSGTGTLPDLVEAAPVVPVDPPSVKASVDAGDLQPLVDLAVADLSARLSVDPGQISITAAERVVWPDGSLGCPQPGMAYTQVQVDGTYVELSANGVLYPYHSGGGRGPFLCESKG
jgi:hypothetical protein